MIRIFFIICSCFLLTTSNAQVIDNFTDGDYTLNPVWTPSAPTDFTIASGQLKSINTTTNTSFYLSTTNTLAANCVWEFWVNLQFATSGANYVDAYLTADNSNLLSTALNGYFVRIGNTSDDICLYKNTAGTQTIIIDGANASVSSTSNNLIKIRVTRTSANVFTLERDLTGTGTTYITEGTITDGTFTSSLFFGFAIKQSTASFFGKHFFDDISVSTIVLDVTAPTIISATATSSTSIDVLFNEAIDLTTSQTSTNYSINPAIGNPISATRDVSNLSLVHLTFGTPLSNGNYTMSINGVQDLVGNAMTTSTVSFNYFVAATPNFKDIVINEIYADPSPIVNLTATEFIELYNNSSNSFNLSGLKLTDGTSIATLGNYTLASNSYVIVCPIADTAQFTTLGYMNKLGVSTFPSLNNASDNIYLENSSNVIIDSVNYFDTWYQNTIKKNGGWSLEQINPNQNVTCAQANNWIASTDVDGGTPGFVNSVYSTAPDVTGPNITAVTIIDAAHISVCFNDVISASQLTNNLNYSINNSIGSPSLSVNGSGNLCAVISLSNTLINNTSYTLSVTGITDCNGNSISTPTVSFTFIVYSTPLFKDVVINEMLIDVNPLPAGIPATQYLELYNKSTKNFNLNGWQFTDGQTISTITTNYALFPNSFVVIAKSADTALFIGISNKIGTSTFPTLNVTGDLISLSDNFASTVDSLRYTTLWYKDAVKDDGGWSLEQINPNQNAACLQANNWIASNDADGGTPGFINSVYSIAPDITGPSIASLTIIDSTHISVCFDDFISTSQLSNITNYSINNSIGSPSLALNSNDNLCVTLSLSNTLVNNTSYTLAVSGISDCSGNAIITTTLSFTYVNFEIPNFKDIVINEIYADPSPLVNLTSCEFIELYNKSTTAFNLNGLKFTDGTSIATFGTYTLAPNSYVIICPIADTAQFTALGYSNKLGVSSFPSLNNAGDNLYLKTATNSVIDSVNYFDTWYKNATKKDGGYTLELINPTQNVTCSQTNNWIGSNDVNGGTPGFVNSVYSVSPDVTGPKINSINVIDSTHISVCFDDVISASQLSAIINYTISGSIGSPIVASAANGNTCVSLTLSTKLINATNYTLTVFGLTDCNGNLISPNTGTLSYYKYKAFDIVINELMPDPDPAVDLPNEEYVELKNRTPFNINLKNWSFSTTTSSKKLPDITIKPDSFIVLTGAGNAPQFFDNFGIVVNEVISFPALTNTSGILTLRDSNGVVIHTISYLSGWYNDANKEDGGWSMEQIDPNNPCAGQNNWRASNHPSGGSPGRRNSVFASNPDNNFPQLDRIAVISADTIILFFTEPLDSTTLSNPANYNFDNGLTQPTYVLPLAPDYRKVKLKLTNAMQVGVIYNCTVLNGITDCVGNNLINGTAPFALPQAPEPNDVVINEILFDPNTGGVDFVELYNRSGKTINLKDIRIGSMDTITGILNYTEDITTEGYLLFPEKYVVISENGTAVKQIYLTSNPKGFLDIPTLPSMNTTSDVVTLSDANFVVIDNFKYTSKMHFPLLVSTKGVSLERIDFNRPTNDRTNWNSASEGVGFATPAYRNSQYLQADGGSGVSIPNPLFSPDNDGYNDVLNISYQLDEPGKAANVYIYDSRGRQVRHLIRNEQLAQDGTLSWNGINDDNEKAPIGIYVVYVELFNLSGKVNKYKLSCTLAGKL